MAAQHKRVSEDSLERDLVGQFGFSSELPVFELHAESLRFEDMFDAFASTARDKPSGIHFSFAGSDTWTMLLVPEGLHAMESAPGQALRGDVWHDDGAYWVLQGWGQLFDRGSGGLMAGSCRVRTPRGGFGRERLVEPCIGQLDFTGATRVPSSIAFVNDPRRLCT